MSVRVPQFELNLRPWSQQSVWLVFGFPAATLIWVTFYCTGNLFADYMRTPTRHLYEVVVMAPLLSIVVFLMASLSQAAAYVVVTAIALWSVKRRGRVWLSELLLVSPLLGLLAWFGYERFVPSVHLATDSPVSYEYGLTLERFLRAWGFELLVVIGYWLPLRGYRSAAAVPS